MSALWASYPICNGYRSISVIYIELYFTVRWPHWYFARNKKTKRSTRVQYNWVLYFKAKLFFSFCAFRPYFSFFSLLRLMQYRLMLTALFAIHRLTLQKCMYRKGKPKLKKNPRQYGIQIFVWTFSVTNYGTCLSEDQRLERNYITSN